MKITNLIIIIAVVLGYYILNFKKQKPQNKQHAPPTYPPSFEENEEEYIPVENKYSSITEQHDKEYFTYETISSFSEETNNQTDFKNRNLKNEEEKERFPEEEIKINLSFEKEELYKGIIFSEILKRPYNW
jgi:hypothetical protein